jgi:hypothetical protein
MATLKRDKSGAFVLRFWTAGRRSKLVYRLLGRMSHLDARDRARAIIAEDKQGPDLAEEKQEPDLTDDERGPGLADKRQEPGSDDDKLGRNLTGPSAVFRRITEKWYRR